MSGRRGIGANSANSSAKIFNTPCASGLNGLSQSKSTTSNVAVFPRTGFDNLHAANSPEVTTAVSKVIEDDIESFTVV